MKNIKLASMYSNGGWERREENKKIKKRNIGDNYAHEWHEYDQCHQIKRFIITTAGLLFSFFVILKIAYITLLRQNEIEKKKTNTETATATETETETETDIMETFVDDILSNVNVIKYQSVTVFHMVLSHVFVSRSCLHLRSFYLINMNINVSGPTPKSD